MYIKPLLKLLKKNTMSDDIRDSLSSMVKYIMHKDSTSTADLLWTEITAAEGRGDIILMGTEGSDHF